MNSMLSLEAYHSNKDTAINEISNFLKQGSLALFLGSGVSCSIGLPNWTDIVYHCANSKNIVKKITNDTPITELLRILEEIHDECDEKTDEFKNLVSSCFEKFHKNYGYENILNGKLLTAIGALLIPCKTRGFISEVVTYNFDDILEWYLALHGIGTEVIYSLPYLARDSDITIYHPHGYLPQGKKIGNQITTGENSSRFIFDQYSYECVIGNTSDTWNQMISNILERKIALMVGLSYEDIPLRVMTTQVYEKLNKYSSFKDGRDWRPIGVLLKIDKELEGVNLNEYYKRGIAPIGFEDYDDIWKFLLDVCQANLPQEFLK